MKIEARKKSTGEIRLFAEDVWAMMERAGHVRRGWDFIRWHEIEAPEEIRAVVEAADKAGREDLAVIEAEATADARGEKTLAPTGLKIADGSEVLQEFWHTRPQEGIHVFTADMPPKAVFADGSPVLFSGKQASDGGGILSFAKKGKKRRKKTAQ